MGLFKSLLSLDPYSMKTYKAKQNLSDAIIALREKYNFKIFLYYEHGYKDFRDSLLDLDNLFEITLEVNLEENIKCLHVAFRGAWVGAEVMHKYGKEKMGLFFDFFGDTNLTYGKTTRADEFIDMFQSYAEKMLIRQNNL